MADIADLGIKVDSRGVAAATGALKKFDAQAVATTKATDVMGSAIKLAVSYFGAREILQATEQWTTLNNRLRLVTDTSQEFAQAQQAIFQIAQQTRQGLGATAELYQRIAQNQRELNISGAETAEIVKTINQTLAISGTQAASANAALIQLGQAFASGTLRGEELNSVLEQAPALAKAIADGMGVTVGSLRALGESGTLSAQNVIAALQNQRQATDELFGTIDMTISSALTTVENAFTQFIGKMDESSGASSNAAKSIRELAEILEDPQTLQAAQSLASGIATAFTAIISVTREVVGAVEWMAQESAALMGGIAYDDVDRLTRKLEQLESQAGRIQELGKEQPQWLTDELNKYGDALEYALNRQAEIAAQPPVVGADDGESVQQQERKIINLGTATAKLTAEQKLAIKAAKELATAQQSNSDVIASMAEELYQASLGADELAQRQAVLRLNEYATPEQIESARMLTAELFKQNEAARARADIEARAAEGVSDIPGGGQLPFEVGGLTGEQQRLIVEAEQLAAWRATELENQRMFLEAKAITEAEYAERIGQIRTESDQRAQQINLASQQVQLASAQSMFASLTQMTAAFAGEQSAAYKAMFLVQQAAGIAQSLVAINTGIAMAAANPFPLNLAAMASVASATAGLVGNISAVTASFDGGGFTGNGPRSGGIDGKGGFMAIMHPNETVIDHTKGQSVGGGTVVNITNAPAGTQVNRSRGADGQEIVDVVIADLRSDGPISRTMGQTFGSRRVGA